MRELKPRLYARYVDDFIMFSDDKNRLQEMKYSILDFLADFRLRIHDRKSRVYQTSEGLTFLGWCIFPDRMWLVRGNVVRFRRRLRALQRGDCAGRVDWDYIEPRVQAWIAHAAHGDTWRLREEVFDQGVFQRGSAV